MKHSRIHREDLWIIAGLVLLLTAGGVCFCRRVYLQRERRQTEIQVLDGIQEILPEDVVTAESLLSDPDRLPVAEVNGVDCIGKIEMPASGISFPVESRFADDLEGIVPRAVSGEAQGGCYIGTVSAGTNNVREGDAMIFTDVSGSSCHYIVDRITDEKREAKGDVVAVCREGLRTTYICCVTE